MSDKVTFLILALSGALRQIVPMFYLGAALYLGLEGGHRRIINWCYILVFGGFGVASYMLLNEPGYGWIPPWVSAEVWLIVVLIVLFLLGIMLFLAAIELQDLDPPQKWLREQYQAIINWLR